MISNRFDFVFSYWIFAWYILYICNIVKYNPKWALTIGLIENVGILFLMFFYKHSIINIFLFCFINFFIKVLPLWSLRNSKYDRMGIYSLIVLFFIYLSWVKINNIPFKNAYGWIKTKNDPGPSTHYIKKILNLA
jgi:archaellum biogenesis protein FlaJ (TadC family)